MQNRNDIQVLRGLAVLAICGFHLGIFHSGYLGVDLFFVVSGFVITPLILEAISDPLQRRKGLANFYQKRFFRLAPALSVMLVLFSLILVSTTKTYNHPRYFHQAIASLFGIGNLGAYRYSGNYFHPDPNAFIHTWSLGIEEQVYVLLPLALLLVRNRLRSVALLIITLLSLALWASPEFTNAIYKLLGVNFGTSLGLDFYSPLHRFWEFGIGALLSLIEPLRSLGKFYPWLLIVIGGLLVVPSQFNHVKILTVTILGLTLALLLHGTNNKNHKFLIPLSFVGDRSYSVYLVHMPIIVGYNGLTATFKSNVFLNLIIQITCISISTHYLYKIENRFRITTKQSAQMSIKMGIFTFTFIPLLVLSFLLYGAENRYFGLDKSPPQLAAAWSQDPNCDRDNSQIPCKYPSVNSVGEILLIGDSTSGALSEVAIKLGVAKNLDVLIWSRGGAPSI